MEFIKEEEKYLNEITEKLGFPVIVKPGNLGSSVGIKKANNRAELEDAIEFAMEFSDRIIVEKAVVNLKEINCSVLGNITTQVRSAYLATLPEKKISIQMEQRWTTKKRI